MAEDNFAMGYALGQDSNSNNDGFGGGWGSWIWIILLLAVLGGGWGGGMIAGAVWSEHQPEKVDERKAMEWTRKMKNPDGSTGPHFKPETAEQLRTAHCPMCDRWEFMVAINMMYADYAEVAKKFGADKPEFYVCMAKAFLEDPDAKDGKLARYMEVIPE